MNYYPRNILYASTLCSERLMNYLFDTSFRKPAFTAQKFHRLFVEGLYINGCTVKALSAIPISRKNQKKLFWTYKSENESGIEFIAVPFINIPLVRHLCIYFFSFILAVKWCRANKKQDSLIICDVLSISVSTSILAAAKLMGFKTAAIVTDLPKFQFGSNQQESQLILSPAETLSSRFMITYDYYVLLTNEMNGIANPRNKPFTVIEGMVDNKMKDQSEVQKDTNRVILYSGAINEAYGIKNLIEAFQRIEGAELQLSIYGHGDMELSMPSFCARDRRIKYYGMAHNDEVVLAQQKATLLINPRLSNGEYTRFSFPSKNMEYMVSGTPTLTTALPGMPQEYYNYVFILKEESTPGIEKKLREILSLSSDELTLFGKRAKQFVLENKNNVEQTEKVLKMIIYSFNMHGQIN